MKQFEVEPRQLSYKNYTATVTYSDGVWHGVIADISDLVYFEGKTLEEAEKDFYEAVEHYMGVKGE